MRKIEILVPSGVGNTISQIAKRHGASDAIILKASGQDMEKDLVLISAKEDSVDEVIKRIHTYCETEKIEQDIRLWKASTPFSEVEDTGVEDKKVPFEELTADLYNSSSVTVTYLLLVLLSAALAMFGLLQNSPIVVIGAMIIAPLLRPIMTASFGTVKGDILLFVRGMGALFVGMILSILLVFLLSFIIPGTHPTPLVITISQLNLLTIGIAFVAGLIAAVSIISDMNENIAGVAIAVALMPPMAAAGINAFSFIVGISDFSLLGSILLVLGVNVLSINIAGFLVFYLIGVSRKNEAKKGVPTHFKIALTLLLLFSLPFIYSAYVSFNQSMQFETINNIVNENAQYAGAKVRDLNIEYSPLVVEVEMSSTNPPPELFRNKMRLELENALGQEVQLNLVYILTERV